MDDNDILDLAPLPLDDAMIKYAYICGTMLCCEYGWREFKQLYECTETPDVLLDKFWDKIMPNLERNAIVRQTEGMARKLKQISNPRDYPPYPTRPLKYVTRISRLQYEDQRNAELERKLFNKPEMVALKQMALDYIREYTANLDSMPGASRDPMPGPFHSILEPSLDCLQFQRMSRANDDPTIIERLSVLNQSHSNDDGTNRLSQGSTSVSAIPEMDQSRMEQSVRQSSGESTVRQGSESSSSRSPM